MTKSKSPHKWRKGSVFTCSFRRIDRNDLARILFLAEALDRRTHTYRKHGGSLGRTGLAVLRALICRFYNKATGQLDPSIEAIAKAANVARSTAQAALDRLEAAGLIERIRRIIRKHITEICELTGRPQLVTRVVQTSNAYLLNIPLVDRTKETLPYQTVWPSSNTGLRLETSHIYNPIAKSFSKPIKPDLFNTLERLGKAIQSHSLSI